MSYMYMKIHLPSMLAIGVDKHTQQTNKQPQWLHVPFIKFISTIHNCKMIMTQTRHIEKKVSL